VLHDVTELRRLESSADFVANSRTSFARAHRDQGLRETLLGPRRGPGDAPALPDGDRSHSSARRLIDDLLTLSDLELGRTPSVSDVALAPAVEDVLQILDDAAGRAGFS